MAVHLTLLRHAESTGNAAGVWQGSTDAELTPRGRAQADAVVGRLAGRSFDLVVSTGMRRTDETIAGLRAPVEVDPGFREIALGEWEGLSAAEVRARYPDAVARLLAGEDVAPTGGETLREFVERIVAALAGLLDRLDDGDRVLVVTHGGVIQNLVAHHLGLEPGFRSMGIVANTSLTELVVDDAGVRLEVYNDAVHLPDPWTRGRHAADPHVHLIRHGETDANVSGRWQGRTDTLLNANGLAQAELLAKVAPPVDVVVASPLRRARDTADALARLRGVPLRIDPDLVEIDFGSWENRTREEIAHLDAEGYRAVYGEGRDLPRGGTGETFAEASRRIARAVARAAEDPGADEPGLVGHGGAFRAYVATVLGLDFVDRDRLALPRNASVSTVRLDESGATVARYNVAVPA
ncbi:MAG TPA: histidine phosphatase family protein [Actinobacteria bacterium]|nr:histidine phosphatase family protein [Actinomycetota bacterium]